MILYYVVLFVWPRTVLIARIHSSDIIWRLACFIGRSYLQREIRFYLSLMAHLLLIGYQNLGANTRDYLWHGTDAMHVSYRLRRKKRARWGVMLLLNVLNLMMLRIFELNFIKVDISSAKYIFTFRGPPLHTTLPPTRPSHWIRAEWFLVKAGLAERIKQPLNDKVSN